MNVRTWDAWQLSHCESVFASETRKMTSVVLTVHPRWLLRSWPCDVFNLFLCIRRLNVTSVVFSIAGGRALSVRHGIVWMYWGVGRFGVITGALGTGSWRWHWGFHWVCRGSRELADGVCEIDAGNWGLQSVCGDRCWWRIRFLQLNTASVSRAAVKHYQRPLPAPITAWTVRAGGALTPSASLHPPPPAAAGQIPLRERDDMPQVQTREPLAVLFITHCYLPLA